MYIWQFQILVEACGLLVAAFGIQFPDKPPPPLPCWECGVLATGPPEKFPHSLDYSCVGRHIVKIYLMAILSKRIDKLNIAPINIPTVFFLQKLTS